LHIGWLFDIKLKKTLVEVMKSLIYIYLMMAPFIHIFDQVFSQK